MGRGNLFRHLEEEEKRSLSQYLSSLGQQRERERSRHWEVPLWLLLLYGLGGMKKREEGTPKNGRWNRIKS